MQSTSLSAWLAWLEQNHPREIDLGLARIKLVAQRMALLQSTARVVTVAGTNGKGSCVTTTAALLKAAGLSVGVYTSPHLIAYNERVVVDGVPVSDAELCQAFNTIYAACQLSDDLASDPISLTYFEYGTLAALQIFCWRQVDAIVLEVGLGGRLDAVNIIDADVAVITSIALDHTDWLGDSRELIGFEKAGIMRARRPVVCADTAVPESILSHAVAIDAEPYLIERDFGYQTTVNSWSWWTNGTEFKHQPLPQLPLPSVAAALQVARLLGLDLAAIDAFNCIAGLRMWGRFQSVDWCDRKVILDVAHNPAATAYLSARLAQAGLLTRPVHAIVAMMSDKDRLESLKNLSNNISHWYLAELEAIPRAASSGELQKTLAELGLAPQCQGSVAACLSAAYQASAAGDLILIFGSFYTVAAGLQAINATSEQAVLPSA